VPTLKKIEAGNRELKTQLTSDIAKAKREMERQIESVDKKVGAFGGKMDAIMQGQGTTKEALGVLEKNQAKTSEELKDLTNSIPAQYRQVRSNDINSGFG